jgi:hypothetical protein
MATTTPNFGWAVPTSTDLVKDGAVAIETLGDAIDASLLDLKGGTTNQVLAKNSNTDMDFKWVSDATGMTNPMTTTGDTIYSSSGSTPARLGIGTAGQVLQVNSGATAPEWATASSGGMTLLNTYNITAASTLSLPSISGSYNNLMIVAEGYNDSGSGGSTTIQFNGDTASNYRQVRSLTSGTTLANNNAASSFQTSVSTNGAVGAFTLTVFNYKGTAGYKTLTSNFACSGEAGTFNGAWNNNNAITSALITWAATPVATGTVKIYGVK